MSTTAKFWPAAGAQVPFPTASDSYLSSSGSQAVMTPYLFEKLQNNQLLSYDPSGGANNPTALVVGHQAAHLLSGSMQIDGDKLAISFVPSRYTRTPDGSNATASSHLSSHFNGINSQFAALNTEINSLSLTSSDAVAFLNTDLTTLTGSIPDQIVRTVGLLTAGDGAEGSFYWASGSSTTSDNALVYGSTSAGRWIRMREEGFFNIRWYGALGDDSGDTVDEWLTGGAHDLGRGWTTLTHIQSAYPEVTTLANTIDEAAFRKACASAIAQGKGSVYIPAGTYIFTNPGLNGVLMTSGSHLEVYGAGAERTILKRAPNIITGNHQYMMYFQINSVPAKSLVFHDFAIDSNAQNQTQYAEFIADYDYQNCSSLRVKNDASGTLDNLEFRNIRTRNPVADQLAAVFNTTTVTNERLIFDNIWAENREATRADIITYPGTRHATISNCRAPTIECEYSSINPDGYRFMTLTNTYAELLDLAGKGTPDCLQVIATNVVTERTMLWLLGGVFTNCDLKMDADGRLDYLSPTRFVGCTFRLQVVADEVKGIRVFRDTNTPYAHIVFDSCKFLLDTQDTADVTNGFCIYEGTAVASAYFDMDTRGDLTEITNCTFDHRTPYSLFIGRGGRTYTRGNDFRGHVAGVQIAHGGSDHRGRWESTDDRFDNCTQAIEHRYAASGQPTWCEVKIAHSNWKESWPRMGLHPSSSTGQFANVGWQSTRICPVTSAPTGSGIVGDIARLITPVTGSSWQWLCTGTGATTATWASFDSFTYLQGTATYNPNSLADGAGETTTVTVNGAALGDLAVASFSNDLQGITLSAWVSATNTVSVRFQNESGGTVDLASGTLKARVYK